MDFFKEFLSSVIDFTSDYTTDNQYSYQVEDYVGEIYLVSDEHNPICLIEYDEEIDKYLVNFKAGLSPQIVADITYKMTLNDKDIVILDDFIVHETEGMIFGDDARAYYCMSVYNIMNNIIEKQNKDILSATYIVKEPLNVFTSYNDYSSKIKQLWIDEDF